MVIETSHIYTNISCKIFRINSDNSFYLDVVFIYPIFE